MIDAALLAKFKRRAKFIASQDHLDRAMFLFPLEHHEEIAAQIQPLLTAEITARKVDALPELKIQNPSDPLPQELTAQRLNNMAATITQMKADQQPLRETVVTLQAQVDSHVATIAALTEERNSLQAVNISLTAQSKGAIATDR